MVIEQNLIRHCEFANGWAEEPDRRRGIGPQSQWLELGPVEWVKRNVLQLLMGGWRRFWFHAPFGVGSFADNGAGAKIPVYEFDAPLACRDSSDVRLRRLYDEFPLAMELIREVEPQAEITLYLGRFAHLEGPLKAGKRANVFEMIRALDAMLPYLVQCGISELALDNAVPDENSEEHGLMVALRTAAKLRIEPLPRSYRDSHLLEFPSCIAADYMIEQLGTPGSAPFSTDMDFSQVVLGRLAPGSTAVMVSADAQKWLGLRFAYGVQHHLVPLDMRPETLLGLRL